jgi:hypothetical protein
VLPANDTLQGILVKAGIKRDASGFNLESSLGGKAGSRMYKSSENCDEVDKGGRSRTRTNSGVRFKVWRCD